MQHLPISLTDISSWETIASQSTAQKLTEFAELPMLMILSLFSRSTNGATLLTQEKFTSPKRIFHLQSATFTIALVPETRGALQDRTLRQSLNCVTMPAFLSASWTLCQALALRTQAHMPGKRVIKLFLVSGRLGDAPGLWIAHLTMPRLPCIPLIGTGL